MLSISPSCPSIVQILTIVFASFIVSFAGIGSLAMAQEMRPHFQKCDARRYHCNDKMYIGNNNVTDQRTKAVSACRIYIVRARFGNGRIYVTTAFHGSFPVVVQIRRINASYVF